MHELNRSLPLVKWFLAIPHYVVLWFLGIAAFFCVVIAWFAILFTGRYPRSPSWSEYSGGGSGLRPMRSCSRPIAIRRSTSEPDWGTMLWRSPSRRKCRLAELIATAGLDGR